MAKKSKKIPPLGEMRQSQLITTFGAGAMVDLPKHSVIVGGLDYWRGEKKLIEEERLAQHICRILELGEIKLYAPPIDNKALSFAHTGVAVFTFPLWYVAQIKDEDREFP